MTTTAAIGANAAITRRSGGSAPIMATIAAAITSGTGGRAPIMATIAAIGASTSDAAA